MRHLRNTLLVFLAFLLLAAGAAVIWRNQLAVYAFDRWLAARDLQGSVQSVRVGSDRVEIRDLQVEQAKARRVELAFRPLRLLQGEIPAVHLEGLELPLDLTGEGPPLKELQPLLGEQTEVSEEWRSPFPEDPPKLTKVLLEDARLLLETPGGLAALQLDGTLEPIQGEAQHHLSLNFAMAGPGDVAAKGEIRSSLQRLRPETVSLHATADAGEAGEGSFELSAERLAPGSRLEIVGDLRGTALGLSRFLPSDHSTPERGRLEASIEGSLVQPPLPYLDTPPPQNWTAWLAALQGEGSLDVEVEELGWPDVAQTADLHARMVFRHEESGAELRLREPLVLEATDLGPLLLEPLPPALAQRLQPGGRVSLTAPANAAAFSMKPGEELRGSGTLVVELREGSRLTSELTAELPWPTSEAQVMRVEVKALEAEGRFAPFASSLLLQGAGQVEQSGDGLAFALDIAASAQNMELAGASAEQLQFDGRLEAGYAAERLSLRLGEQAVLALEGLRSDAVQAAGRVEVVVDTLQLDADLGDDLSGSMKLRASPGPLTLNFSSAAVGRLDLRPNAILVDAEFAGGVPSAGAVQLDFERIELPERQVVLTDVEAELPLSADAPLLRLRQARLASAAAPSLFPPLDVTGSVERDLRFEAQARGLNAALDLRAEGQHDSDQGRGQAVLTLAPLNFTPGGLQPAALGPYSAEISQASGRLQAQSRLTWTSAGLDGTARIRASNLGFSYAEARLDGLNFDITLAGLQPPRTAEPQQLSIERLEAGFPPLTGIQAWVALRPTAGGTPSLLLQRVEANFAGGRARLVEGSADPTAQLYRARLELERLDLEVLLSLIGLEELSGQGRVSGTIPIELRENTISIDQGLLQGDGRGVIAFRSPDARSALAAGGEAVSLMFDALENFHYEQLEIGLNKPPVGDTEVRLKLLGANPDVLEGHPFDLNINLETNAAPLLEALAESRRIQQGIMNELWRLVR